MLEVLRDERSRGCVTWPVSDEDTSSASLLSESPGVPYTLLLWIGHLPDSLSGFIFLNAATIRLFLDIYRFIATVIFNIPFTSHCFYDYFGTSLNQGTPAVSVLVLS